MREDPPKQRSEAAPAACPRARGKTTPVPDTRREDEHVTTFDEPTKYRRTDTERGGESGSRTVAPGSLPARRGDRGCPDCIGWVAGDPQGPTDLTIPTCGEKSAGRGGPMSSVRRWSVPKGTVGAAGGLTVGSVRRLARDPEVRHARLDGIDGFERSGRDGDRPRRCVRIARVDSDQGGRGLTSEGLADPPHRRGRHAGATFHDGQPPVLLRGLRQPGVEPGLLRARPRFLPAHVAVSSIFPRLTTRRWLSRGCSSTVAACSCTRRHCRSTACPILCRNSST